MRTRSAILNGAVLACLASAAFGAPADETLLQWRTARREQVRVRSLAAAQADKVAPAPAGFALLVIPVDFTDAPLPAGWETSALAPRLTATGGQSLRHYFRVASAGRCELMAVTAPPVHLSGTQRDYSDVGLNGFTRTRRLATEALAAVADAGFDFRLADDDGPDGIAGSSDDDGWVDGVLIVHAARGRELDPAHGLVEALQYYLAEPVVAGGVSAGAYAVASLAAGPGVWAHEVAHLMGMEDRYDPLLAPHDAGGDLAGAGGLGDFSLMASGAWGTGGGWDPALPDAYSRAQVGWCDVATITDSPAAGDTLPASPSAARAHRVWSRDGAGPEFLLLEARDPATTAPFDAALPGAGLLVIHVDEDVPEGSWSQDGFQQWHLRAQVLEADADDDLRDGRNRGAAADLFPGAANVTSLTPATSPASDGWQGPSGVSITGIATVAGGVTYHATSAAAPWAEFTFAFPSAAPYALALAVDIRGGDVASLHARVEPAGATPWGAFAGDLAFAEFDLALAGAGRWVAVDPPLWIANAFEPGACTAFEVTLTAPGLATVSSQRTWCWANGGDALDFAADWPGGWTTDQPSGPGTSWRRWTGAASPARDGQPVLVCTGDTADPSAWPAVAYTNGGRARLTSGPLPPAVTAVRLVHWVDVETLPGGVPMDGASAVWVGPDGIEFAAEPVGGWRVRVDDTSGSALRGHGAFADPRAALDGDQHPIWRAEVIPLPGAPGPWRLRLDFAANDLWRGRGWLVAACQPLTGTPADADITPVIGRTLAWSSGPVALFDAPATGWTVQARALPDSAWLDALAFTSPGATTGVTASLAEVAGNLFFETGARLELRVTGGTPWGKLATTPVAWYPDGDNGSAPMGFGPPWPNPAGGAVRFTLVVPEGSEARLRIFDLAGRLVHTRTVTPGTTFAQWDGRTDDGQRLPAGTYIMKLDGSDAAVSHKVVLWH
jgi:M6 family metalloprotease-like protein